jgi:hypothetical protein
LEFVRRRPGLAIVVVHHVRKAEAVDVFDTISGTYCLTGVFDTLMVRTRRDEGAKLAAQGRDLDGYEKALERDSRTGGWIVKREVVPLAKTGERQELLNLLAKAEGPLVLAEIAEAVGKSQTPCGTCSSLWSRKAPSTSQATGDTLLSAPNSLKMLNLTLKSIHFERIERIERARN